VTAPSSSARIAAAFEHRTLDRVPFVIPGTLHGARLLGVGLREYFERPEHVVEGQLRLRAILEHDAVQAYPYVSAEHEAFGGETIFPPDGPPVPGPPPLRLDRLGALAPPEPEEVPVLRRILDTTRLLVARVGGECPVMGAVVSPFSLPSMLFGLPLWLELLHEAPTEADRLLAVLERFAIGWAHAQLRAGVAAIEVIDPLGSPEIASASLQGRFALPSLRRTIAGIGGAVAVSHASARGLGRLDAVLAAGAAAVVASAGEPLSAWKAACAGRALLLGGLDSLSIHAGSAEAAARAVRAAIAAAAPGGGFVLTEHHGEIPWQVPLETLLALSEAARRFGRLPLTWIGAVA